MARSMVNQNLYLGLESAPGTQQVTDTKRVLGLRVRPGFNDEGEGFKAEGYKVETAWIQNNETGSPAVEAIQDFNAFTWLLTGAFGAPTTTQPDDTNAPTVYQHAYALDPNAADDMATFTAVWGDSTQAIQMLHFFFQSLSIGVQRGGSLSLNASAMSAQPSFGATIPNTGVTEVPSVPVGQRMWDIYADDSWAALGTTKLLAAYEGNIEFGDKYTPDYTINSEVASYSSILEAEDTSYSGNLRVGLDATAVALANTFTAGSIKFLRFEATGANIEDAFDYSIQIDLAVRITSRGEVSSAPNSPAVSLPFSFNLTADATSGNAAAATLINTVESL